MTLLRPQAEESGCWEHPMATGEEIQDAAVGAAAQMRTRPQATPIARLVRTIEGEIIPRLMLAHCSDKPATRDLRGDAPTDVGGLDEFCRRLMEPQGRAAAQYIEGLRARGVELERILLDLMAPAARRLGDWWAEDLCDFTQCTIGVLHLQQILHGIGSSFETEVDSRGHGPRALLVPLPGEQHSFGMAVVVQFFRRAGWEVCDERPGSTIDLVDLVSECWFDVIGLSLGCVQRLDDLARAIHILRQTSVNRSVGIMVGGPCFLERPDLVTRVGADATASDGRDAVSQARRMLELVAAARQ